MRRGGGRSEKSFISPCDSVSVSVEYSGAFLSPVSRLVGVDSGELVLGEPVLFPARGGDSGGCLFEVSCVILLCIMGVIVGFGLGFPLGVSPLGFGSGWL